MSASLDVLLSRAGLALSLAILAWSAGTSAGPPDFPQALIAGTARGAPIDAPLPRPGVERLPVEEDWPAVVAGARIDLERLAFDDYDPPELRADPEALLGPADFPAGASGLDGLELRIAGYPLVLELSGTRTERLLLTRFPPGCCFGAVPVLDEWVLVELEQPVEAGELPAEVLVGGTLEVGEELDGDGAVGSLYRLRGAALLEE